MDGFSAVLSQAHLDQLQELPGHLSTYPETFGHLHTTHTPTFLGLKKHTGLWSAGGFGDDMIIGVLDTGISPENASFNDEFLPPVPERWRGACESSIEFNSSYCNRKLIGARSFNKGSRGIARVMEWHQRLGLPCTKFCSLTTVMMLLAGMDQDIRDGVDVMSLSLGFFETPFDVNLIAIGAFAALKKGIFVSCSAGNDVNRNWKICLSRTGAAGAIFNSDDGQFFRPTDFYKPLVLISPKDGELVKNYIINSKNATVSVRFQTTLLGTKPAPQVAHLSSRGPDRRSPLILKPDILAAGVPNRGRAPIRDDDYLLTDYAIISGTSMSCPHAAGIATLLKATHRDWSLAAIRSAMMTTADVIDNTNGPIIDMTTEVAGTSFDFGAGRINPNKALDPGLVYDIEIQDYIDYLCALNYTTTQIRTITGMSHFICDNANLDLNYPSFLVLLNNDNTTSMTFQRQMTNVADGSSVYRAVVRAPSGMKAVVQPATITFEGKYSKSKFQLTVDIDVGVEPQSDYFGNYGFLSWYEVNGKHEVTSPIVSAFAP
ncbi:hypothetical protein REPUB_Repub04eG0073600 [Reevesia pubescens]